MSDKTFEQAGGLWSYPAKHYNEETGDYETKGMVWMGYEAATQQDKDALFEMMGKKCRIDKGTVMGRYHPEYSSYWESFNSPSSRMGGLGSQTYEHQKVGRGVEFHTEPIWHHTLEGEFVKEVPGNVGESHEEDIGQDTYEQFEGPAPDSEAQKMLGDGKYKWNTTNSWYTIKEEGE